MLSRSLEEVHESRMDTAGNLLDSGGNNEGYFCFNITSAQEARQFVSNSAKASSTAPRTLSSRGTIYRAVSRKPSGNAEGAVFSAENGLESITTNSIFEGIDWLDLLELLAVFGEGFSNGDDDNNVVVAENDTTYSIIMDITYDGDEYYPEAYLYGVNYKEGSLEYNGEGEVENSYMKYRISLVPHTTTTIVLNLSKEYMDYENGTGFEIVVPALSSSYAKNSYNYDDSGDDSGNDSNDDSNDYSDNDNFVSRSKSSGGGCETGAGILPAILLAFMMFSRAMKRR